MLRRSSIALAVAAGSALCKDVGNARVIVLSRPGRHNTMTVPMLRDLYSYYITQPHPSPSATYVVKGEGVQSFCAGGDVMALSDPNNDAYRREFFLREYQINYRIATMPQVQVALWNGNVMGSGVGISIHGTYRVACEHTRFGMPETQLGAVPDVGTCWRFYKLPVKGLGPYLTLTGNSLRGSDLLHAGIATHYVPYERFTALEKALTEARNAEEVRECLGSFSVPAASFSLAENLDTLRRIFTVKAETTVAGIMDALKKDGSLFATATLSSMEGNSPGSMALTLESLKRQYDFVTPLEAFSLDYRLIQDPRMLQEFRTGVQARLIDKSPNPKWDPPSPAEIDQTAVLMQMDNTSVEAFDPHAAVSAIPEDATV